MCADRCTGGVDNEPPKYLPARIFHLDDTLHTFQVPHTALGAHLYHAVIHKLGILEADYFDLEYVNHEGVRCWLEHQKTLIGEVGIGRDLVFRFSIKFYTPHPNLLEEEYTRYLFALQIKRDILGGLLICSENTAALLASYIVQAEIGDFIEDEYLDILYLRPLKILPEPTDERLKKVMDFHRNHIGLTPAEADFNLLDTARKVEYFGIRMHLARDHEGLPLNLAVSHTGVVVFQNLTRINNFSWAKIRKLSFKRKRFLVKLHPEGYNYYKDPIEFYFDSRDECKRFWKKAIEHHAFFRRQITEGVMRRKNQVVTKGSSYRYTGRTQKQLIEYAREHSGKRPLFERPSMWRVARPSSSMSQPRPPPSSLAKSQSQQFLQGKPYANSSASINQEFSGGCWVPGDKDWSEPDICGLPGNWAGTGRGCRSASHSPTHHAQRNGTLASNRRSRRRNDSDQVSNNDMHPAFSVDGGGAEWQAQPNFSTDSAPERNCSVPNSNIGRVVCMDQYSSSESGNDSAMPPHSGSLPPQHSVTSQTTATPNTPRSMGKWSSTPALPHQQVRHTPQEDAPLGGSSGIVYANVAAEKVLDSTEDVPYVLLRRHISPSNTMTRPNVDSIRHFNHPGTVYHQLEGCMGRLVSASMGGETHKKRKKQDEETIESLKSQLRSVDYQAVKQERRPANHTTSSRNHPTFVSVGSLPPVNNFSAHDDTTSPPMDAVGKLYGKPTKRTVIRRPAQEHQRDVATQSRRHNSTPRRQHTPRGPTNTQEAAGSVLFKEFQALVRSSPELRILAENTDLPPEYPLYLESSNSSSEDEFYEDGGEMANKCIQCEDDMSSTAGSERCSRPQSVSDIDLRIQTPKSARKDAASVVIKSESSLTVKKESNKRKHKNEENVLVSQSVESSGSASRHLSSSTSGEELRVRGHLEMSTTSSSTGVQVEEPSSESDDAEFMPRSRDPSISSQLDHVAKSARSSNKSLIEGDDQAKNVVIEAPRDSKDQHHIVPPGLMVTCPSPEPNSTLRPLPSLNKPHIKPKPCIAIKEKENAAPLVSPPSIKYSSQKQRYSKPEKGSPSPEASVKSTKKKSVLQRSQSLEDGAEETSASHQTSSRSTPTRSRHMKEAGVMTTEEGMPNKQRVVSIKSGKNRKSVPPPPPVPPPVGTAIILRSYPDSNGESQINPAAHRFTVKKCSKLSSVTTVPSDSSSPRSESSTRESGNKFTFVQSKPSASYQYPSNRNNNSFQQSGNSDVYEYQFENLCGRDKCPKASRRKVAEKEDTASESDCTDGVDETLGRSLEETVETNLLCDSTEISSRPQSEADVDEYVLSHTSTEDVGMATSSEEGDKATSSEEGCNSSASEGSEDIEPFPPPPPDLMTDKVIVEEEEDETSSASATGCETVLHQSTSSLTDAPLDEAPLAFFNPHHCE